MPQVKTAAIADQDRAIAAVVLGFSTDPVARWSYPKPHDYLTFFPRVASALGGNAFQHGTAYYVADYLGAALWLPPGVAPREEEMMALMEQSLSGQRLEEVSALLEQMGGYHPSEPHWYLPLIGVDTMQQGKRYGSALMAHALIQCDRDSKPAYLESIFCRLRHSGCALGEEVVVRVSGCGG
jgi:hypothetical protein